MSRARQIALLASLVVVAFLVPYVVVSSAHDEEPEQVATVPASDCPEANQVYVKEHLTAPDTYSETCPDPAQLRADLKAGQHDLTKFDAMSEALEAGRIEQDQNPCTYPADLREVIELSDAQCDGELGEVLKEQYP